MVIIETPIFTRLVKTMMNDELYRELQESLVINPDSGDLIKGSGGLRKLRWKLIGQGKRGGVRIIYYWLKSANQIYMLYIYKKSNQSDLTPDEVATLKLIMQRWLDGKKDV